MSVIDGTASDADTYACFLRAELDSPTEGAKVRLALTALDLDSRLVAEPDTSSDEENQRRRQLFDAYRGHEPLFVGLRLDEMKWAWVDLSERDLRDRVLSCRHHFEATYGTRDLAKIAALVESQDPPVPNGVIERLRAGEDLEPPILLGEPDMARFVVLEGHNRLISYLRDSTNASFPIRTLIGTSPRIADWREW